VRYIKGYTLYEAEKLTELLKNSDINFDLMPPPSIAYAKL
jgi:hypothetical protein